MLREYCVASETLVACARYRRARGHESWDGESGMRRVGVHFWMNAAEMRLADPTDFRVRVARALGAEFRAPGMSSFWVITSNC
jgi:hypothetical protein